MAYFNKVVLDTKLDWSHRRSQQNKKGFLIHDYLNNKPLFSNLLIHLWTSNINLNYVNYSITLLKELSREIRKEYDT